MLYNISICLCSKLRTCYFACIKYNRFDQIVSMGACYRSCFSFFSSLNKKNKNIMTKKQILEGNILIAEFMGLTQNPHDNGKRYDYWRNTSTNFS